MNFQLDFNQNIKETGLGQPSKNLINFQFEFNQHIKEMCLCQGQPNPRSHQFSIRIQLEFTGNWSEAAQARISSILNSNSIRIQRKFLWESPEQPACQPASWVELTWAELFQCVSIAGGCLFRSLSLSLSVSYKHMVGCLSRSVSVFVRSDKAIWAVGPGRRCLKHMIFTRFSWCFQVDDVSNIWFLPGFPGYPGLTELWRLAHLP